MSAAMFERAPYETLIEKLSPQAEALHCWVMPEGSQIKCDELVINFYAETLRRKDGHIWLECDAITDDFSPYCARVDVTLKEALSWLDDKGGPESLKQELAAAIKA